MKKTKASFKMLRELVGIGQTQLAEMMGVLPRSVRRWEQANAEQYNPPEDAWSIVLQARAAQVEVVDFAIEKAVESGAKSVILNYWSSAEAYEAEHPGHGSEYQMANANTRLVFEALEAQDIDVEVAFDTPFGSDHQQQEG